MPKLNTFMPKVQDINAEVDWRGDARIIDGPLGESGVTAFGVEFERAPLLNVTP
jgi:hypothetical protein